MVASATTAAALRDACIVLAASGRLRFWKVDLDGRPVAMLFAIVDGEEAWLGKIAHDESFARFSPGTLVTLYATEQCFRDGLKQVDSCAVPDHPMINRLWRDRLHVADVMVASTDMPALAFTLTATSERLRRTARQSAKSLYHAITGQRSS
jgi:CelD/BcsL family acetyltransferase involved in cellulose biosynthesis